MSLLTQASAHSFSSFINSCSTLEACVCAKTATPKTKTVYANAHRGKVKKASLAAFPFRIVEEELRPTPSKGWAEMIRKVYEVDPLICPRCGGQMKVIAFLTDYAVVDRIINHLNLTFVAERPPPPQFAYQEVLIAAEAPAEYSS